MFQITDKFSHHLPVKSGFETASQALHWAKKHLEPGSCSAWGKGTSKDRYFIKMYKS